MQQQQKPAAPQTVKVEVLRSFYYKGKAVEKGAIVELPRVFAIEMRDAKKAALVVEAEKPTALPAAPAKADKADAGKEKK